MARSMNPELYRATIIGDIDRFIRALEDRENCLVIVTQVSPQGNTVLHIAAGLGHDRLIEFILRNNHDLVKVKNSKSDLVFHLSVSAGHLFTINLLASSLRQNEFMDVLKEQNKDMNTALHAALKKHHKEVAFSRSMLIQKCRFF
ncbi:Ankyrin repeat and SAM domain-containing protein 1A [Camellia lanceoleosa]|uniref:Ankyrin repeat and SAM domain-containing protein 1A n=2 Tax=Camellia lanceoleosa TaxID=1840588 RepID=A0ACC0H372_9ERIC|nr:Ankyrin repeat and SAM domain-containing protein 1A [Camellia lanceoleosa]KAI8007068.1 Ankyrin repeat and SAM domain-containing protein 1A [Camellia lanceoleosa]